MNCRRRRLALKPVAERLDDRCLLSGLTPAQLTRAYGLDAITFANGTIKGDGSGQTIALVEAYHSPYLMSDLKTFNAAYGLPEADVTVVNQGDSTTDDGWALETAMDVQWAHAIAPGAKILVVEARSQSVGDLMAAVDTARRTPGVVAVSMSWGFSEFAGQTAYDSIFTTPTGHQGVTFFAASGDSGTHSGAEWPSASPNVVSVGGTTLTLDADGSIANETAWIDSGGGVSLYARQPSYQKSIQSTGMRSTPDIAFVADPRTGVSVYSTAPSTGVSTWQTMGGTSLGAPAWAAIMAIVDQGLVLAGKDSLDGPTQTLPALYALAHENPSVFRSVTAIVTIGSHDPFHAPQDFRANLATGLGTPNGLKLVTDLTNTPVATSVSTTPPPPTEPPVQTPAAGQKKKKKKHHTPVKKRKQLKLANRRAKRLAHVLIDAALAELGD